MWDKKSSAAVTRPCKYYLIIIIKLFYQHSLLNKPWKINFLLLVLPFLFIYQQANALSITQPNTFAIVQDHQGFIWTAGHNGLTRHNSNKSITFSSRNKDWPLPFDWIQSVSLLNNNKLLLATENNKLWQFDTTTGKSSPINVNIHQQQIIHAVEHQGGYFINVPNKLYYVDKINNQTILLADNIDIVDLKATKKYLYVTTSNGLFKLVNYKLTKVISGNLTAMASNNETIVVAAHQQLIFIDDDGNQKQIPIKDAVYAITAEINTPNIFTVSSKGQIRKYSTNDSAELTHAYPNSSAIFTRAMLQDSSGVLWLLTSQGIIKLSTSYAINHQKVFDVTINGIALATLNNDLIIGSYGKGLSSQIKQNPELFDHINQQLTYKARIITDLLSYGNDLYIASFDGLWRYNSIKNTVARVSFPANNDLLLNISIKDNFLYIATDDNGFYIYDLNKKTLIDHVKSQQVASEESIDILPLSDGSIWIATTTGVNVYNPITKEITKVDSPGQNKVSSLLEYENKIFVATKGDGIFVYNQKQELLSHFATKISFVYLSLINDEIWATAEPGLYKINPRSYQLTLEPNTEQYTFTSPPVILNNTAYIGHYGGILELPLSNNKKFNPKVYISKTQVSGQVTLLNKSINVQSPNDVITLELASLDYRSGQDKEYKYQINNGLWHQVNGDSLTLTGLSSGQYNIEIMATNSLGQWSDIKAYTEINVAYPWYWTPQIRVLYTVAIICIILLIFWLLYLRSQSISHIHQLLKADLHSRGKTALNVSRNLNLALDFIESDKGKSKIILQQCIDELNKNDTNTAPDSLYGNSLLTTLPFLCEYVHKKYHVNLKSQIEIDEKQLSYEMQADIYKIIYEAIISAILNSNGRNFKISMQEFKGKLWLTINDDSHSFANYNNKINFDMAMYYIRQIAAKYKASVNTFDEQDSGSQLVISIPIINH